jgi:SOS response regulatory protein OraA/RecX
MPDFLNRINPEHIGLSVFLILVFAVVMTFIIGMFRYHAKKLEQEHALKQEMIAKGMSADDIERVIGASSALGAAKATAASLADAAPKEDPSRLHGPGFDKTHLVAALVESGIDAAGIEQLLRTLQECADDELPAKVAAIESLAEQGMEADDIERVIRAFHRKPAPAEGLPKQGYTAFRE